MENSQTLLYMEIYQKLYKSILASPGLYKLKSERILAEEYGVSRITIRHAIRLLAEKGIIKKKDRSASFIRQRMFHHDLEHLKSLKEEMDLLQVRYTVQVLQLSVTQPSPDVAEKLKLDPQDEVYFVVRLIAVDGIPFIYEESFMPVKIYPRLKSEDVVVKYDFIKKVTGLEIQNVHKKITAEIPSQNTADILQLKMPAAVLHIDMYAELSDGRVCDYVNQFFHPDYMLTATTSRD